MDICSTHLTNVDGPHILFLWLPLFALFWSFSNTVSVVHIVLHCLPSVPLPLGFAWRSVCRRADVVVVERPHRVTCWRSPSSPAQHARGSDRTPLEFLGPRCVLGRPDPGAVPRRTVWGSSSGSPCETLRYCSPASFSFWS